MKQKYTSYQGSLRDHSHCGLLFAILVSFACSLVASAQTEITAPPYFDKSIRPLLGEFCLKCHSTEKHKGDLDLERFSSFDEVKKHPKVWQAVVEQLANNEMPPKDKPQPAATQREELFSWANAILDEIALARAGDPGPVVLRRLSNAEYTYTIRDLTGVPSLDPAREFPVDGAAGEGFMNTGNALVMSPSLFTKYLDAGKEIATHAVLLSDGIHFSPKTTRRDWTEEILAQIRSFYREFTDPRGGDKVNLQGIVFETNEGGRLPLEKYLAATLELRNDERMEKGKRSDTPNIASPLTPALSPGEREIRAPAVDELTRAEHSKRDVQTGPGSPRLKQPGRSDLARTRRTVPPLPEGEGRGEGEGHASTRDALVYSVAAKHGLSPKYLAALWNVLNASEPSLLLDPIRARWRNAQPADVAALAVEIGQWQKALWKFGSVGHIGKLGGPKAWMEPVSPLSAKQEVRLKIPASPDSKEITLYLVAGDAGDGNGHDFVIWQKPRLIAPGRSDLLLRDLRDVTSELTQRRERIFATTAKSLLAAAEARSGQAKSDVAELARKHGVEADALAAWLDYLGIGSGGPPKIEGYFTNTMPSVSGYDFIKGWGAPETPEIVANSSDQHVRIPGNMKPHGIAVHPSPKLQAAVGWRSPVAASLRIAAKVQPAHPECGNGVTWSLELRRGATRQRLAAGTAQGAKEVKVGPFENLAMQPGDLVSLLIGPRDGNHSCDLTAIDLVLTSAGEGGREWNLAADVSADVLAGNPHADRFGNESVWHFYTEPDKGGSEIGPVLPADSLLAKWQSASSLEEKQKLADQVQNLLASGPPAAKDSPDAKLYQQLASLGGPLFSGMMRVPARSDGKPASSALNAVPLTPALSPGEREKRTPSPGESNIADDSRRVDKTERPGLAQQRRTVPPLPEGEGRGEGERHGQASDVNALANNSPQWALDSAQFGHHPDGQSIDAASLCVHAPSIIEVRLPADLVAGWEFVTTGVLDERTGTEGSVQLQVLTTKPEHQIGLLPSAAVVTNANGAWTSDNRRISHATPVVVNEGSAARKRIEAALDEFRQIFPAALCYTKIVPVDEVVTLTLFYREDDQLARLMLDDSQRAKLDRLWNELHYVSQDALTLVDAFEQIWQFATQDADPKVFEPLREPIKQSAAAFRQRLIDTQPKHIEAVLEFANRAYRRPLLDDEKDELRGLYGKLREQELPHDQAIRLVLARVLVAPAFLYRAEKPGSGSEPGPVNDWELANRLSYFLWSSLPDAELREIAAAGKLRNPDVLVAQTRRMLGDERMRRMATEFGCAWLHIHGFDELNEKSERHFPTFTELRGAMYEESIRFFTDFFQRDRSVLNILDADYAFVNEALATHYGIPGVTGAEWRRVDGIRQFSRGGILGQATTLAKQSGASRTSPILRGNWVTEVLLGEKLPKPPKEVPRLPEDETATEGLTVRQLVEKHTNDPNCAGCHRRIDPYGYALEGFDAIGRRRERDLADRPIDSHAKAMDGAQFEGIDGLRDYLLTKRRDAFLKQFCRKLLGYSLGRAVQISDGPLLAEMRSQLKANDYHVGTAIETIVRSRQFREIRGKEMAYEE